MGAESGNASGIVRQLEMCREIEEAISPCKEADKWLARVGFQHSIALRTRLNTTEKRLGDCQLPVDGFNPTSNISLSILAWMSQMSEP